MNRRYLIWAPPFCGSAGVRALYKLAAELREHGQSVSLWSWGDTRQPGFDYAEPITSQMREEDIVIYPEVVEGNPLRIRNVVRWVLFFPGRLGGESSFHPSEKIFTWSDEYYPEAAKLTVDIIDRELFFDAGLPRSQDCTFIHKRGKWKNVPELEGLTEITMEWPKNRTELAQLLQKTGTLYTWDDHSALCVEAYCCGAKVKIITEKGYCDFFPDMKFVSDIFEQELAFFISDTQSMNYTGKIQPIPPNYQTRLCRLNRKWLVFRSLAAFLPLSVFRRKERHYHDKLHRLGWPSQ